MAPKTPKSTNRSAGDRGQSEYASSFSKTGNASPRMQRALIKAKTEAREKVIERGIVQFRADPTLMRLLLQMADEHKTTLSELCRNWTTEKAQELKPGAVVLDGTRVVVHLSRERMDELLARLAPEIKKKKRNAK